MQLKQGHSWHSVAEAEQGELPICEPASHASQKCEPCEPSEPNVRAMRAIGASHQKSKDVRPHCYCAHLHTRKLIKFTHNNSQIDPGKRTNVSAGNV